MQDHEPNFVSASPMFCPMFWHQTLINARSDRWCGWRKYWHFPFGNWTYQLVSLHSRVIMPWYINQTCSYTSNLYFTKKRGIDKALSTVSIFGDGCARIFSCPWWSFFLPPPCISVTIFDEINWWSTSGLQRLWSGFFKCAFNIILYLIMCYK